MNFYLYTKNFLRYFKYFHTYRYQFLDDANANRRIESEWSPASEGMRERYVESLTKAYQECNFTYEPKSNLSVLDSMKSTILSMVETNSVVIIQGPTGCGKTTQIPQLILDANIKKRLYCNIIGMLFLFFSFR